MYKLNYYKNPTSSDGHFHGGISQQAEEACKVYPFGVSGFHVRRSLVPDAVEHVFIGEGGSGLARIIEQLGLTGKVAIWADETTPGAFVIMATTLIWLCDAIVNEVVNAMNQAYNRVLFSHKSAIPCDAWEMFMRVYPVIYAELRQTEWHDLAAFIVRETAKERSI